METPSQLENYGALNQTGRLVMEVQTNITGSWATLQVIYNQSLNISLNSTINLSQYWDGWIPGGGASGFHRARVQYYDANYSLFQNGDGTLMEDTFVFYVTDIGIPQVTLNAPLNIIVNTPTVMFNFTPADNSDLVLSCNLLIDDSVVVSSISSPNGSNVLPNVTGLRHGLHLWNVTCPDDDGNSNTSIVGNFTYDKLLFSPGIQTVNKT